MSHSCGSRILWRGGEGRVFILLVVKAHWWMKSDSKASSRNAVYIIMSALVITFTRESGSRE